MNDASGGDVRSHVTGSRFAPAAMIWVLFASSLVAQGRPASGPADAEVSQAPFQLTPQDQQFIDELLTAWESRSREIKKIDCQFSRWEYSPQFGPRNAAGQLLATSISVGELKYIRPDRGVFHVTETQFWNPQTKAYQKGAAHVGEHFVCDGKFFYELDGQKKQVIRTQIPPEMQGKQIIDGPFPFLLFGAEAAVLKRRYWIRERTDAKFAQDEIWLEAHPRWRNDAAQMQYSQLIMKRKDFLPYALRMFAPNGKDYNVYEFTGLKINNILTGGVSAPGVPRGWQLVEQPLQAAEVQPNASRPR
jgi:TIGR03009 family protein